ncbi:MAG TPA: succinylglutamate desuccinylase/aspartoacylase family protein [Acidimicrobiia bacterium]|nr:succinylglutamate desuccinylase/aspartoacylase family protein [Acidimicrobiia bacterium]
MSDLLTIGGRTFQRGTKDFVQFPVLLDLDGSQIQLTVHVLSGARPGPRLAVVTVLHGSEWQALETSLGLIEDLDPSEMSGDLVVVPVANPIAFATGTRNIIDESDSPDLNRSFGGRQTWLADQLARALVDEVLSKVDAVIDFHTGLWGAAMGSVTCGRDFSDPSVSERALGMALAFGMPHVRRGDLATKFPGPASMIGYAGEKLGVPGIISEIGGVGFAPEIEQSWVDTNLRGVRGVMKHLGILDGEPEVADEVLVFDQVTRVNPTVGGILEPIFPPEGLMRDIVEPGQLLGRVWSPYTFEVIEELRSPARGLVDMVCRPYPVRPGDWAYLVIDLDSPTNYTLKREA